MGALHDLGDAAQSCLSRCAAERTVRNRQAAVCACRFDCGELSRCRSVGRRQREPQLLGNRNHGVHAGLVTVAHQNRERLDLRQRLCSARSLPARVRAKRGHIPTARRAYRRLIRRPRRLIIGRNGAALHRGRGQAHWMRRRRFLTWRTWTSAAWPVSNEEGPVQKTRLGIKRSLQLSFPLFPGFAYRP